LYVDKNKVG